MRGLISAFTLFLLLAVHVVVLEKTSEAWKSLPRGGSAASIVMPAPLLKIVSLEFDGIASDILFLKAMAFIGENLEREKTLKEMPEQGWKWLEGALNTSADLDPYFVDPYYVGNAYLTWDGGRINEANALLEKGSRARDWDWSLPFFMGFNQFYFLQNNEKAGEYLMESSRRPGASPVLASLASKLAYKAKRTENSILFLEEILKKTDDEVLQKEYKLRLESLRAILALENAVNRYRQRFRRVPRDLDELLQKGIIAEIPKDPQGGKYYINAQGSIRTTSESKLMPAFRK